MALNVTTADLSAGQRVVATPSLVQWDEGQVLLFSGAELPAAFRVDFRCLGDATTIPATGTPEGAAIPDDLLKVGKPLEAYVVLFEGDDARQTEYWITIQVKPRPVPTGTDPTPEQADVIDDYIRQLAEGVSKAESAADNAEEAVTHYPKIEEGTWRVWDAENETWVDTGITAAGVDGEDGEDGYSPTVTVTEITGGHRVTVTDKTGDHVFDVMDGEDGDPATNLVKSVAGKTGVVTLDGGDVGFDDAETYEAGTVGAELTSLSRQLSDLDDEKQDKTNYVTLTGTIIEQAGVDNTMYLCGELAELTFTAPQTGQTAIRFSTGTTATVASFPNVTWLNGFDPTSLETERMYEINILNLVGVASWT